MFTYPIADVYPSGLSYFDTSNSTAVSDESSEALQNDSSTVKATHQKARSFPILLGLGVLLAGAVFFGME